MKNSITCDSVGNVEHEHVLTSVKSSRMHMHSTGTRADKTDRQCRERHKTHKVQSEGTQDDMNDEEREKHCA